MPLDNPLHIPHASSILPLTRGLSMPMFPMTTLLLETAASAPCARVRLMCWNVVSRTVADADGAGFGEALAEKSMR
jgi:hypothetical protein